MKFRYLYAVCTAVMVAALPLQAASDYLLELDGIPGESADEQHTGTIEVQSWSLGASNPVVLSGGGGGAGKVTFSDISVTKALDKSSPLLYLACAQGKHIRQAILYVRKNGNDGKPVEYYVIKLQDILVTSVQTSGGGDRPTESLSLNFTKIEFIYTPQKPDGTLDTPVRAGWDIATNTGF